LTKRKRQATDPPTANPDNVVVPRHDIPMVQNDGRTGYPWPREAAIKAWFGDDLETTTTIELTAA
jgi:hypothetical protein